MPLTALLVNDASQTDPSGHAPNAPDCNPLSGWYAEDGGLEISTAFCDYFSGVEGAAVSADAGDVLLFDVTHYDLTSPTPAEAHISLSHGETVLLDMQVAIPGPADVLHREVVLKEGIQAGAPITLHVHNHGQNTWIFEPVRVQRQ